MRVKYLMIAALVCGPLLFASCDDDDNNDKINPDSAVERAFDNKYPDAKSVNWEREDGYVKADFRDGSEEAEAWFDEQGNWLLTETDLPYNALPAALQESFKAGIYGAWQVDDVDKLERPDSGTVYVLDVESGEKEVTLHYTESGILLKEYGDVITNNGNNTNPVEPGHKPTVTPTAIKDEIAKLYPGSTIFEIDPDNGGTEVDILHDNIHKEVWFDSSNTWLYTEWEIRQQAVPQEVLTALNKSYGSYRVEEVHAIQKSEGLYYEFELESADDRDMTVYFDAVGNAVTNIFNR